jgi:hypothetical protein
LSGFFAVRGFINKPFFFQGLRYSLDVLCRILNNSLFAIKYLKALFKNTSRSLVSKSGDTGLDAVARRSGLADLSGELNISRKCEAASRRHINFSL